MSSSDTPSGKMLLAMSLMLVIFQSKSNLIVNYKESRTVDYTAQVKISIL